MGCVIKKSSDRNRNRVVKLQDTGTNAFKI